MQASSTSQPKLGDNNRATNHSKLEKVRHYALTVLKRRGLAVTGLEDAPDVSEVNRLMTEATGTREWMD